MNCKGKPSIKSNETREQTSAEPVVASAEPGDAPSAPEESPPSPGPPRPSSAAGVGGGGLSRFNVRKVDDGDAAHAPPPPCPPATPSDMVLPTSDPSAYEPAGSGAGTVG